jgi:hypothetical protein
MRFVQEPTEFVAVQHAVAYHRVSTARQGRSGLGIEAQRDAVASFVAAEAFEITAEYVEVEIGKGADALDRRPQLALPWPQAAPNAARSLWPSSTGYRATLPL